MRECLMIDIIEKEYRIESLNRTFTASILLPDDYDVLHTVRYPVLYVVGVNHLFDVHPKHLTHWNVKSSLDIMKKNNLIEPMIVVSIKGDENFEVEDYVHNLNQGIFTDPARKNKPFISNAKEVANLLVHGIKPDIDKSFRTKPDLLTTGIIGVGYSSIFALYILSEYSHIFGKVGLFSMPLWLISNEIYLRAEQLILAEEATIYHYIAEKETSNWVKNQYAIYLAKKLNTILYKKCKQLKFVVGYGEDANVVVYKERFPEAILTLFRKEKN